MRLCCVLVSMLIGVLLSVAGCNKPADQSRSGTEARPAGDNSLSVVTNGNLPAGFPVKVLKPFPGATIDRAVTGEEGSMLEMTSTEPVDKVLDFYRKNLATGGWTAGEEQALDGSRSVAFTGDKYIISLTAVEIDGGTMVNLALTSAADTAQEAPEELLVPQVVSLPVDFPEDILPCYPDATLVSADLTAEKAESVQLAAGSPSTVLEFYQQHFAAIDMVLDQDMTIKETRYISFIHADGSKGGVGLTLHPGNGGKTNITLAYEFDWVRPED